MKLQSVIGAICFAALAFSSSLAAAGNHKKGHGGWYCKNEAVVDFWEQELLGSEARGRARLCSTPFGMFSNMQVRGLTPGNAYTVWWVYIDKPEDCVNFPLTPETADVPVPEPIGYATPCGLADFFTPDPSGEFLNPLAVYGRLDSVVVDRVRQITLRGNLRDFQPASGSQVWMFIFGHGPADDSDKRQLARQLLTPEDPLSGVPHLGIEGRPLGYPSAVAVFRIP